MRRAASRRDRVAARLAAAGADAIYSSDLCRALESAEIIAQRLGLQVHACRALRERSYGAWEGLTRQEVEERFPESWAQWRRRPTRIVPKGASRWPR